MATKLRSFATEFLLRELLAALGARAPGEDADAHAPADSFSESLSEDTESQTAPAAAGSQSRVMLVRRTNSSRQTVTLVDREFDVEAFVPSRVANALLQERGFQTLGRLRGSVVRVTKYHFATMARCLAAEAQSSSHATSVSAPSVCRGGARVYLWVDALAIVEENELAVKTQPEVYGHPAVAERLQALSDAELEKQLMINQGLPPMRTESDRFDDDRPLRDEDCVIPEDQEQQLEEQDDWGLPTTMDVQPTDSELIEENGHVPMPESQVARGPASQDKAAQSTQDSLPSYADLSVTLSGNSLVSSVTLSGNSMASSVTLPGNPSVGDVSVDSIVDSPKYPFQQENIRETFVVESDTEDEHGGVQEGKQVTPRTPKSQQQTTSSSESVHMSPAPSTPKTSQSSCMIVDLTGDSPEKAPLKEPTSAAKSTQDVEPKIEADDSLQATGDAGADQTSSNTAHQTPETQRRSTGWRNKIYEFASNLVGIGTPSAEDSHADGQPTDEEKGETFENEEPATQLLGPSEEEKEDAGDKHDEPVEYISSQATVVLQYAIDNDEDANAFEYEGIISDDMASPRSAAPAHEHTAVAASNSVDDELTLTEEVPDVTVTPERKSPPKEAKVHLKTPSPSQQAGTPGTEQRSEEAVQVSSLSPAHHSNDSSQGDSDDSHPASPPDSKDPVLPTDASARLSPAKSPSKLVISVDTAANSLSQARRNGPSTARSRTSKRSREQAAPEGPPPAATSAEQENTTNVSSPQPRSNDQQRAQAQKRRRREILSTFEGESQSPQFEQPSTPFVPRRKSQSDRATTVGDKYSLEAVCRSLGSHTRAETSEDDRARSSRQPRRAWKRYENLFPTLNMTRLKQMIAEGKGK